MKEVERGALQRVLAGQAARYPQMQVQDLYKLLHQAALGSEHAVQDLAGARAWLEREVSRLGDGPADPLLEAISPDGRILRVHLRPYLRTGQDVQALLAAFIRTAEEFHGSKRNLKEYGAAAARMAAGGMLPFSKGQVTEFFAAMERQDFPAVDHSPLYQRLFHPAYRVVSQEFLEVR